MDILIVGLGLMGGAYALRLSKCGHRVYGSDINENSIKFAKANGYIIDGGIDPSPFIKKCEVIVLAIYPQAILNFLNKYNYLFNDSQIITDICGVKSSFVNEATNNALPAVYCSHHPMAGREKIGVEFSHLCSFEGANFLIVPLDDTPKYAIDTIHVLGEDLGFSHISVISVNDHDDMIAFTSQLAHAIAVSLVNSDHNSETKNYIGDSYRDLTRIAMINENLWSELFLENKKYLLKHIESFEHELDRLKDAINDNDLDKLKDIFKSSTRIRREMEKWKP